MTLETIDIRAATARALSMRAVLGKIATEHSTTYEELLSTSQRRHVEVARQQAVRYLRDDRQQSWGQIGLALGRNRSTVLRIYLSASKRVVGSLQHFDPAEIHAQLRRVSGVNIVYPIIEKAGLKSWQAQFLAILGEAYPRVLTIDQLCELYDSANSILDQDRSGADSDMVKQFVYSTRKTFREHGLPEPVKRIHPEGIRLTHECARWMCYNIGVPAVVEVRGG